MSVNTAFPTVVFPRRELMSSLLLRLSGREVAGRACPPLTVSGRALYHQSRPADSPFSARGRLCLMNVALPPAGFVQNFLAPEGSATFFPDGCGPPAPDPSVKPAASVTAHTPPS